MSSSDSRRKSLHAQSTSRDLEAEEDPVGEPVGPRVQRPDQRVGALDPKADDDVRLVGLGQAVDQPAEVGDLELAVAIGERDELVAAGARSPTAGPRRSRSWSGGGRRARRPGAAASASAIAGPVLQPSSTAMISNVSARVGRTSSASSTRPSGSLPRCGQGRSTRAARRARPGVAAGPPRPTAAGRRPSSVRPRLPMTRVRIAPSCLDELELVAADQFATRPVVVADDVDGADPEVRIDHV